MSLAPHWRGHFLLFERRPGPAYPPRAGLRLLLIVVLLEAILGPRYHLFTGLGIAPPPPGVRVVLSLALALLLARYFARVGLGAIGFRPWREWSATEKSYFAQVVVIANAVFAILLAPRLQAAGVGAGLAPALGVNFLWGFHQEVVYRGLLQTELERRWGPALAVFVGNVVFTFGPLHFYHFSRPNPWPMLAAIFAIGLFFALLYQRSRNLWIVAVLHGIGTAWILASVTP